jgi:hypothetical protein
MIIWWVTPTFLFLLTTVIWNIHIVATHGKIALYALQALAAVQALLLVRYATITQLFGCNWVRNRGADSYSRPRSLKCALLGARPHGNNPVLLVVFLALAAFLAGFIYQTHVHRVEYEPPARMTALLALTAIAVSMCIWALGICPTRRLEKRSRKGGAPLQSCTCVMEGAQRYGTDGHVYEKRETGIKARWVKVA